jgi:hypothetical protein
MLQNKCDVTTLRIGHESPSAMPRTYIVSVKPRAVVPVAVSSRPYDSTATVHEASLGAFPEQTKPSQCELCERLYDQDRMRSQTTMYRSCRLDSFKILSVTTVHSERMENLAVSNLYLVLQL